MDSITGQIVAIYHIRENELDERIGEGVVVWVRPHSSTTSRALPQEPAPPELELIALVNLQPGVKLRFEFSTNSLIGNDSPIASARYRIEAELAPTLIPTYRLRLI